MVPLSYPRFGALGRVLSYATLNSVVLEPGALGPMSRTSSTASHKPTAQQIAARNRGMGMAFTATGIAMIDIATWAVFGLKAVAYVAIYEIAVAAIVAGTYMIHTGRD